MPSLTRSRSSAQHGGESSGSALPAMRPSSASRPQEDGGSSPWASRAPAARARREAEAVVEGRPPTVPAPQQDALQRPSSATRAAAAPKGHHRAASEGASAPERPASAGAVPPLLPAARPGSGGATRSAAVSGDNAAVFLTPRRRPGSADGPAKGRSPPATARGGEEAGMLSSASCSQLPSLAAALTPPGGRTLSRTASMAECSRPGSRPASAARAAGAAGGAGGSSRPGSAESGGREGCNTAAEQSRVPLVEGQASLADLPQLGSRPPQARAPAPRPGARPRPQPPAI